MKLFTIGYSGYDRDQFVDVLKKYNVQCVIDVRSVPASQYRSEFNKPAIEAFLRRHGILYRHMPRAFGARQEDERYRSAEGYVDFEKFARSKVFQEAICRVTEAAEKGWVLALMCAEKDALNCHRCVLAARHFHQAGLEIIHIAPGMTESHGQIERRLLDLHFPERNQYSLLEEMKSDEALLKEAYRLQNRKIGFRTEEQEKDA